MSNRFHSKYHRRNHHTYGNPWNPDASHDPIANQPQPFLGEFCLWGSLSCVAPPSAYGAHIYCDNTALCAWAGKRGAYIFSHGYMGAEIHGTQNIGISAYAPIMGLEVVSNVRAISAFSHDIGMDLYSNNIGISSYTENIGYELYSKNLGLSASTDNIGIELYSKNLGISSVADNIGIEMYARNQVLSAMADYIGMELYSRNVGISAVTDNIGFELYSRNVGISSVVDNIGMELYSRNVGISSVADNIGFELYSENVGISAVTDNIGIELYSLGTAISSYAALTGIKLEATNMGAQIYSPNIALSTGGGGVNIFDNKIGIFTSPSPHGSYFGGATPALDVNGNTYIDGSAVITGDMDVLGELTYLDTKVTVTSSFRVENTGTDAAATIIQTGAQPILACYDNDVSGSVPSLIVDGATNGWVGIGTSSPSSPFNIVKNTTATQGNNQPQIRISDDNTTTKVLVTTPITSYANCSVGTETNHGFDLVTNATPRISISNSGLVGIGGVVSPYNFSVNGTVYISDRSRMVGSTKIGANSDPTSTLDVEGPIATKPSTTSINASGYVVTSTDSSLIFNRSINASTSVTLPTASGCAGRWLYVKNISAQGTSASVISTSSDVLQLTNNALSNLILPGVAGSWAWLQSNGTYWVIMAA